MSWFKKAIDKVKSAFGNKNAGQSTQKCPLEETGLLVVVLREKDRQPIEGAVVLLKGKTSPNKKSDKDGIALFKPLDPDTYDIDVTLPRGMSGDYEKPDIVTQSVSVGACPICVIHAKALAVLKVKVVYPEDDQETILDGVTLTLTGPQTLNGQTPKTNEGWLQFTKIKSGQYTISVDSLGSHANTYETPSGSGYVVDPGEINEVTLQVLPNGWVEFLVVEADTEPVKSLEGFTITAQLPGGQTLVRSPDPDGVVSFSKLVEGNAAVKSIEADHEAWEFVSMESRDKG